MDNYKTCRFHWNFKLNGIQPSGNITHWQINYQDEVTVQFFSFSADFHSGLALMQWCLLVMLFYFISRSVLCAVYTWYNTGFSDLFSPSLSPPTSLYHPVSSHSSLADTSSVDTPVQPFPSERGNRGISQGKNLGWQKTGWGALLTSWRSSRREGSWVKV